VVPLTFDSLLSCSISDSGMVRFAQIFAGALVTAALVGHTIGQGFAPCHSNQNLQGDGVTCESVTIPGQLCKKCRSRPYTANGRFVNCAQIYFMDQECRKELSRYARLNQCDVVRNQYVRDFSKRTNREGLDYFLYSVCEECCDCIPIGSQESEYSTRKREGTLLQVNRGNCGNHAVVDICKVWPQVKAVRLPRATPVQNLNELPAICPVLRQWKQDLGNPRAFEGPFRITPIPPAMRQFLTRYVRTAQCSARQIWIPCYRAESSQGRLSP